jgi:hypothetical protein
MSRIDAWTGRFLMRRKITRPKASPSTQTTSPARRRVRPFTPINWIDPTSGMRRLASPPPAWDAVAAGAAGAACASAGRGAASEASRTASRQRAIRDPATRRSYEQRIALM